MRDAIKTRRERLSKKIGRYPLAYSPMV